MASPESGMAGSLRELMSRSIVGGGVGEGEGGAVGGFQAAETGLDWPRFLERFTAGLSRLRKKVCFRVQSAKSIPPVLKPALILWLYAGGVKPPPPSGFGFPQP